MTERSDEGSRGWNTLEGIRVLDFSALLPGPFATQMLADLGADVVKVEPPAGDFARHMPMEMFRMANRNKRSIALDLKNPAVRPVVEALARWADVVVEGFRPGVVERLGVSWKDLGAINPKLVYCSLSGYGQSGPWRALPGHDLNYLAAGGALSLKGRWLDDRPERCGLPVADVTGSSFAAVSILAALLKRRETGRGCYIDVSLTDAALAFTAIRRGLDVDDTGRLHLYPVNDMFETADGRKIALGMVEDRFWQAFRARVADFAPELLDPRYDDEPSRRRHGDELARALAAVIRTRTSDEWLRLLEEHDIPVMLVMTPREAARNPQVRARGVVRELGGESHVPFPVLVDGAPAGAARAPAPAVGEHGRAVLEELGFGAAEIDRLLSDGVGAS